MSAATGLAPETIRKGRRELAEGDGAAPGRIRRPGAGRPNLEQDQPGLTAALERLVDPLTRGDPTSPLRWTCKSRAQLTAALTADGWRVSSSAVGRLLHALGYRLQALRKTREGRQHPDRNAQFEHINATAATFLQQGQPVISVDTKKKELVGEFKNGRPGVAADADAGARAGARLPEPGGGQGDPVRRLRHGAQRGVGQRRPRPRHVGLRGRRHSPMVEA